jgi:TatA/E family protein of Tat protein translocase
VLLLFGATRLPKIGASLGQGLRAFKGAVTGQEVIDLEDDDEDAKKVKSASKKPD